MTFKTSMEPSDRGFDWGLLLLRAGTGLSLCVLFGIPKLQGAAHYLHTGKWTFVDFNRKVGIPLPVVVAFAQTLNESLGALLVACGLLTRYAAGCLFLGFTVATFCSLKMGEAAWLTAAYFALIFATIAVTGPGQLAIDFLKPKGAAKARFPHSGRSPVRREGQPAGPGSVAHDRRQEQQRINTVGDTDISA